MSVIQIERLQKNYGKHVGTRDVTFSVEKGEIFGFVGPNGAGKSTTIKVLMGFIFAGSGTATINGLDVAKNSREIKAFTGYVPSDVRLYPSMHVGELLKRNACFYPGSHQQETERLCHLFEVEPRKRFSELSTGNKKKVSIICALMSKPKVIILDEPTNGLDPMMQKLLFVELKQQTASGATVLLSSHNLPEVQEYCNRVAFIKNGSILAVTDLANTRPNKILTLTGCHTPLPSTFEFIKEENGKQVYRTGMDGSELLQALSGAAPASFTVENESIEQRFWNLYGQEEK